ncbi:hypothetical protein ABE25_22175 [Cytobacillus firmus]|nr:hypothetical protein [Cytobacillus firmus]MBG9604745.1 hypothetical protein [Cytobacillus firmus]MBG9653873.1 hypothetical protein [Cytobacillus firmus]
MQTYLFEKRKHLASLLIKPGHGLRGRTLITAGWEFHPAPKEILFYYKNLTMNSRNIQRELVVKELKLLL